MPGKNLTLYVDQGLSDSMEKFPEVNWSEIARQAITQYLELRTRTTIPADIVAKLRAEKGQENVSGREHAMKVILPKLSYKDLEKLMIEITDKAGQLSKQITERGDISPDEIDLREVRLDAAKLVLKPRIPYGISEEFVKGVLATLDETFDLTNTKRG